MEQIIAGSFRPKIIIQTNWMLFPEFWSLLTGIFALYLKYFPVKFPTPPTSKFANFQKIEKIPKSKALLHQALRYPVRLASFCSRMSRKYSLPLRIGDGETHASQPL